MEKYGIEFPNVQERKCFYPPGFAGRMRNSSPSKPLKIEIMDGAFFRGLGKTIIRYSLSREQNSRPA
jgi:hypothetical protein